MAPALRTRADEIAADVDARNGTWKQRFAREMEPQ